MAKAEFGDALKTLKAKRGQLHVELRQVDKAISILRGLSAAAPNLNGHPKKIWTMSAAARKKIAKAQRLRWAKFKKAQAKKA